jgi:hypothetical protein
MKKIIPVVLLITGLIVAYFALSYFGLVPGLGNLFKYEVKYEKTALSLENVKAIAKLFSQRYSNEFIVERKHKNKGYLYDTEDKLILIVKGTTYAGTDLSKMKEEDIKISDSLTCEITLPQAEILQNVVNPSDIKVFLAEGYWKTNYDAVQKVKVEAVAELEKKAKDKKIIDKANEKAIAIMKNFMQSLGFKNIKVNIK